MPLIGIINLCRTLEYIIIVPSSDRGKEEGTWKEVKKFSELAERIIEFEKKRLDHEQNKGPRFLVHEFDFDNSGDDFLGKTVDVENVDLLHGDSFGIDMEDPETLSRKMHSVWSLLKKKKSTASGNPLLDEEIIVDITGGQKLTAVAGSISAYGMGRIFQYVSTIDYSIKFYDIEHAD